jgi:hypothetical protein
MFVEDSGTQSEDSESDYIVMGDEFGFVFVPS